MNILKQIRRHLPGFALLSAAFLFCGSAGRACSPDDIDHMLDPENLDMSSRPLEGVVSIREIVTLRRGTDKEVLLPAMFCDDICLNKTVLLDSSEIKYIQPIPIPGDQGFYNLRLDLTERGRKLWINLSVQHKGTELAFVIDGTVYRGFVPRMLDDDADMDVIVDGPFDQATALSLQNTAKFNYFKLRK